MATGYLRALGQQRLIQDVQQMLTADPGLRSAAQRHYIEGKPGAVVHVDHEGGYSSDFSDFEF
jgi:hypothetical protein